MEEQIQRESEIPELRKTNESLSEELKMTKCQLLQLEKTWQEKYEALEKKSTTDLTQQESTTNSRIAACQSHDKALEGKFQIEVAKVAKATQQPCQMQRSGGHETTKDLSLNQNGLDTLQTEHQRKVNQMEEQIQQRDSEILDLSKAKESLSEKLNMTKCYLSIKEGEPLLHEKTWQEKYEALEKKSTTDLTQQESTTNSRIASWQSLHSALSRKFKTELAKTQQVRGYLRRVQEKLKSNETELRKVKEENKVMAERHNKEKVLLEDICLRLKKKSRWFFCESADRETELRRMKTRMEKSQKRARERQGQRQTGFPVLIEAISKFVQFISGRVPPHSV
ncbi:hypothetical protein VZT92_019428 [Zoarces viviparus]|uniref:Uncharacterized protein n=1 Tax=Zoarces viviparus TaxID=48416 RepID=A0AAW1ELN4_ZOAVI